MNAKLHQQWCSNLKELRELRNENKKLKIFESYSYYVGSEITCGRIPSKFSRWLDNGCPA